MSCTYFCLTTEQHIHLYTSPQFSHATVGYVVGRSRPVLLLASIAAQFKMDWDYSRVDIGPETDFPLGQTLSTDGY